MKNRILLSFLITFPLLWISPGQSDAMLRAVSPHTEMKPSNLAQSKHLGELKIYSPTGELYPNSKLRVTSETLDWKHISIKNGLLENYVRQIKIQGNRIYTLTNRGLSLFNTERGQFEMNLPVSFRTKGPLDFAVDEGESVHVVSWTGLISISPEDERIYHSVSYGATGVAVDSQMMYVLSNDGLYVHHLKNQDMRRFIPRKEGDKWLTHMQLDRSGNVYAYEGSQLVLFQPVARDESIADTVGSDVSHSGNIEWEVLRRIEPLVLPQFTRKDIPLPKGTLRNVLLGPNDRVYLFMSEFSSKMYHSSLIAVDDIATKPRYTPVLEGSSNDTFSGVNIDLDGSIYMSSSKGVFRIKQNEEDVEMTELWNRPGSYGDMIEVGPSGTLCVTHDGISGKGFYHTNLKK